MWFPIVMNRRTALSAALAVALGLAVTPLAHAGLYATSWGQLVHHATQLEQYEKQIEVVENTLQSAEDEEQELTQLPGNMVQQVVGTPMSIIDNAAGLYQQLGELHQNVQDVVSGLNVASQVGQQFQISPSTYYYDRGAAAKALGGQYETSFQNELKRIKDLPAQLAAVKASINANSQLKSQVGGLTALADETDGVQASMLDFSGSIAHQNMLTDQYRGMQMAKAQQESAEQQYDLTAAEQVAEAAQKAQIQFTSPIDIANEQFGGGSQ
ncbi:MAG TPA: hypothetical protein VF292_08565 [Rhodanobacteraceae bacterium]